MKMILLILISLLSFIPIANATLSSRLKRFLTPTTYQAVPTTFAVPTTMVKRTTTHAQPVMVSFSVSRPINCPVKRDTRAHHIELDSDLMRQIYLHEVGTLDKRLVAETIQEARENLISLPRINHKAMKLQPRIPDIFREITQGDITNQRKSASNVSKLNVIRTADERSRRANETISGLWDKLISSGKRVGVESHSRVKRNADGTETAPEFCHPRGTRTDDGYVHMCSVCAYSTKLPKDRFPRYVNEIGCNSKDCNCFTINDISHGKCQTKILTVKVLRKVTSGCRLIIHDGQHLITDNWELYDLPLKVGCECVIDKRSPFAGFMGR